MARKKKLVPEQELQHCRECLMERMEHWGELKMHGGADPSWPDGTNMNLTRNHIMYYRFKIAEDCMANGFPEPPECGLEAPPEVPDGYMASLVQTGRVERLRAMGYVLTTGLAGCPTGSQIGRRKGDADA